MSLEDKLPESEKDLHILESRERYDTGVPGNYVTGSRYVGPEETWEDPNFLHPE